MNVKQQSTVEMFLLHLRYKEAQHREAGGNRPILLTEPTETWIVYTGHVDLFLVPLRGKQVVGPRTHLFRATAGEALFGTEVLTRGDVAYGILAVGNRQASVLRVPTHRLHALSLDDEYQTAVTELVDGWIHKLSTSLIHIQPPREAKKLGPGQRAALRPNESASARKGIIWVRHAQGHSHFLGNIKLPAMNGQLFWPLSPQTWLETTETSELETTDTIALFQSAHAWPGLESFHQVFLTSLVQWHQQQQLIAFEQLSSSVSSAQHSVETAFNRLAKPLMATNGKLYSESETNSALLAACELIGSYLGVIIKEPVVVHGTQHIEPIQAIARASNLQIREVSLRGDWWRKDNGPLLCMTLDGDHPVALLPTNANRYALHDPTNNKIEQVTAEVAAGLFSIAAMFYRPLPNEPVEIRDVLKFVIPGTWPDLRRLTGAATAVGVLGLIVPMVMGLLFDTVVPNSSVNQLLQLGLALIVVTLVSAFFQVVQNIAVLRLQDKWGAALQAAIWQRLLNLPVSFFRDYTAGDLGMRVMGINIMQQTLSGTLVGSLLAGVSSLFSFILLFILNARLAVVVLALTLLVVVTLVFVGIWQLRFQRNLLKIQGGLSGLVLQTVTGIAKFRVAGTEHQAFSAWADAFSESKQAIFAGRNSANRLVVFNAGFIPLAMAVLFTFVVLTEPTTFSTPAFLAFNAAFMQLVNSLMMLGSAVMALAGVMPIYERLQPILEAKPELDPLQQHPGELNGAIELSHVTYRYHPDKPPVLKDLSLSIKPGEFVAVVGSSGAGKSTLLRLLLGFDIPESGKIYFDRQDMERLDIRAIRQQIGVVLQSSQVMPGSLMENIIGSSLLTIDDAWDAAKMAGLDEDIRQMPMGMHTMIGAGGGTLSGGQCQRLLIARAVVNRPRIIFFDEATSALDNATQAIVSESLENLQATRLIIAHRLSTIMNADRIYVMDNGQIVETGTYEELMEINGLFASLAERQMA